MGYSSTVADSLYANAQAASNLNDTLYFVIQHQAIISQELPVFPLFKRVPGFFIHLPLVRR
jgi:ABC-type transport system substrate-binding protein